MRGSTIALLAMLCFGLSDFVYKRAATAGIKPLHFITSQTSVFLSLVLVYGLGTNSIRFTPAMMWNGSAGLFMLIGFLCFFRSLSKGALSINGPIFRLNFVVSAVLATVVFEEPLSALKVAAILFASAAVLLLLGFHKGGAPALRLGGIGDVAVGTLALGTANFLHKVGLSYGVLPGTGVLASASVFCALATVTVFVTDRGFKLPLMAWKYSAPAAVALASAFLLLLNALQAGQASVLIPIAQMGFVIPAALGMTVLGEEVTATKVGGLSCAVIALAALSLV